MKKLIFGPVGKMVGVAILGLIVLGPVGMAVVTAVGGLIGLVIGIVYRCRIRSTLAANSDKPEQAASGDEDSFRSRYEAEKRKLFPVIVCFVALVCAALVGWKVYETHRFLQAHQRAMEQLGER